MVIEVPARLEFSNAPVLVAARVPDEKLLLSDNCRNSLSGNSLKSNGDLSHINKKPREKGLPELPVVFVRY